MIGLGALAVVLGVAAIMWTKVGGGTDAIEAVPADAHAVAFFDVLELYREFTSDRVAGFLGDIDPRLAAIDETLAAEVGLTFSDDVLPWIGETSAVWANGDTEQGCLVVSARNRAAADDFVSAVLDLPSFPSTSTRQVDGGTLHDVVSADGESGTIGRVEGVVLICGGAGAADASLAALAGESMASDEEVAGLVGRGNLVAGWLDLPALAGLAAEDSESGIGIDPNELAPAVASFDVTDGGFEWSLETPSAFGVEMADDSLASLLPEGTFLALFGGAPDVDIPSVVGGAGAVGEEFLGLLGLLDGPVTFGVFGEDGSILSQVLDAPLNVVIGAASTDPEALGSEVRALVQASFGLTEDAFTAEPFDGGTLYTLSFPFFGDLAAMAVTTDAIAISATAAAARAEGPRLVDSEVWEAAIGALAPGSDVSFFFDAERFRSLDLASLMEMAERRADDVALPEDAPSLQQVVALDQVRLVVAGTAVGESMTTSRLVVLIDW